jgi:hypothetical protein
MIMTLSKEQILTGQQLGASFEARRCSRNIRYPMIARWLASIPSGGRIIGFVGISDIARMIRAATGLARSPRDQGINLAAVARLKNWQGRDTDHALHPSIATRDTPSNLRSTQRRFRSRPQEIIVWHGEPATERERNARVVSPCARPMR